MSKDADAALRRLQAMMMATAALAMLVDDGTESTAIARSSLQSAVDELKKAIADDRGLPVGVH